MFNAISDPILRFALWTGLGALLAAFVMALSILLLRIALRRRTRRWVSFVTHWRPLLLVLIMDDDPAALDRLPPLLPRDRDLFLRLWLYLYESIRGEARTQLIQAARLLGVDATARHLLRRGSRVERLQAVLALGCLQDEAAWDALRVMAAHPDPLLSINAARALVQIDPTRATAVLMPLLLSREDWDLARLAGFMVDARETFVPQCLPFLTHVGTAGLVRALQLAQALRLAPPLDLMRAWLDPSQPAEVIVAALPLAQQMELHDAVREALSHPDARVREQAHQRMADLGGRQDQALMVAGLDDEVSSVRLAAAMALVSLPFVSESTLAGLRQVGQRGMAELSQALAERRWAQELA